jgi:outer membrane protein assembly factor BamA
MFRRTAQRAACFTFIAVAGCAAPARAQLSERLDRCLPYPSFAQEVSARKVELSGGAASGSIPRTVFDTIDIFATPNLPPKELAGLEQAIRDSPDPASRSWLDNIRFGTITSYLQDHGYFRAEASISSQGLKTDSTGSHVVLSVLITDAVKYRMGKLAFRSADPDIPLVFSPAELETRFHLKEGDVFSAAQIRRTLQDLKALYGSHGFIDFVATPVTEVNESTHRIDVTMELDQQKQFRIGNVIVEAASPQARTAIQAALVPGEIFDATAVTKVLNDNAAYLPADITPQDDVQTSRDVTTGTVNITFHLNPCPSQQN